MIQLNLLPDVKLDYIKAQRQRSLVISASALVAVIAVAITVILFGINLGQKKYISSLTDDITKKSNKLKSQPQIDRILTVQNQLNSLSALHEQKTDASRIFGFMNQTTPNEVSIASLSADFAQQSLNMTGAANTLSDVNRFVDTLKFTTFTVDDSKDEKNAFNKVVLTSFGVSAESSNGKSVTYTLDVSYDPALFASAGAVKLKVPSKVTTRSEISQPTDLFQASTTKTEGIR